MRHGTLRKATGSSVSRSVTSSLPACITSLIQVRAAAIKQNQGGTVRRDTIAFIWIGGLLLAVALYAVGPDRFFEACLGMVDAVDAVFRALVYRLGAQVLSIVRALAIAIYVVFLVLAFLAAQRGHRAVWSVIVVTVIFLMLVGHPFSDLPVPVGRWILALVLVVIGAGMMTQRLLVPPPGRNLPPPYPPGFRQ
jgi:hypothetical protein